MAFIVNSVTQINNYIIRAAFSDSVRVAGDGNFNDGLNIVNYLIKGPVANSGILSQINTVPGNPMSVDLVFQNILTTGNYLIQFSPNIGNFNNTESLGVINNLTLAVNISLPPTLTNSLQAQTAASQLRLSLSRCMNSAAPEHSSWRRSIRAMPHSAPAEERSRLK